MKKRSKWEKNVTRNVKVKKESGRKTDDEDSDQGKLNR